MVEDIQEIIQGQILVKDLVVKEEAIQEIIQIAKDQVVVEDIQEIIQGQILVKDLVVKEEVIQEIAAEEFEVECTDSDGGIDYSTKGIIIMGEYIGEDYCNDDSWLIEYFCEDVVSSIPYSCPNGCEDGVCIQ